MVTASAALLLYFSFSKYFSKFHSSPAAEIQFLRRKTFCFVITEVGAFISLSDPGSKLNRKPNKGKDAFVMDKTTKAAHQSRATSQFTHLKC